MNITKEQIAEWLKGVASLKSSGHGFNTKINDHVDIDLAGMIHQCFQDLAPVSEWVSVEPQIGEPMLFHISLRGYPRNMVTGVLQEDGIIETIDGEDNGYQIEQVSSCWGLPTPRERKS